MSTTAGLAARRRTARRDLRVDAVRGVALVSMYVAHVAPTAGPGHLLTLSEYATFPLFALLVGVGADLASRTDGRWWVGPLVRGAVLIAVSAVLARLGAQVLVVLAHLGVLTWLMAPLARARSVVVGGVGVAALVAAPQLGRVTRGWSPDSFPGGATSMDLAHFVVDDWPYQLAAMVFFACLGVLVSRYLLRPTHVGTGQRLALGGAFGVVAVGWIGLHQAGAFAMAAYAVVYRVLVFDAVLVVAITLLVAGAAELLPRAAGPLAAMGSMSLTLYSVQVVWLAFSARVLHPRTLDDSWTNLVVLVVGSLVWALGWRAVVRTEPWRRGPIEGPVANVVGALTRRDARA